MKGNEKILYDSIWNPIWIKIREQITIPSRLAVDHDLWGIVLDRIRYQVRDRVRDHLKQS